MPTLEAERTARLATVAFFVLLLASFGAFFLANRLKTQPPELELVKRLKWFSPNNDGRRDVQPIAFRIDLDDRAAVDVIDADGARVRRVAEVEIRPDEIARVSWDGKTDDGTRAPDGFYRLRLLLRGEGRAILAPRAFNLDTQPPNPAVVVEPGQTLVAPGTPVAFRVRGAGEYTAPHFEVLRTDAQPAKVVRRITGERGRTSYEWDGRVDDGSFAPPGTYLVAVRARDRARNLGIGPPLPPQAGRVEGRPGITVRSLAVQPPVRPVRAGSLASFRVDSRGRPYRWSLRRIGTGRPAVEGRKKGTTLVVRAPKAPSGLYLLEVRSRGNTTSVPLAVQAAKPARLLVALPMVTWLGRDPVDDARAADGLPDVFGATGAVVGFPRPFAYPGGLPTGLADQIAPLLVWLDRNEIRYDLTTDLELAFSDGPRAGERTGVLLAGAPEWVTRGLAKRLRRYVAGGGNVALFGPGALRASVTLGENVLTRATQPGRADAFGARVGDVRPIEAPLTVFDEDPDLGLLEGFAGELGGFTEVEELETPGPRGVLLTGVGETVGKPALSAVKVGDGLVLRIGAQGWVKRLESGDEVVGQLTRNVVDLLRGDEPKARTAG